jgi:hypothetical protein
MKTNSKDIVENKSDLTKLTNSIIIGLNSGSEIVEGDGIIIIGDNIKSLNKNQPNLVFIGDKMVVGEIQFFECGS